MSYLFLTARQFNATKAESLGIQIVVPLPESEEIVVLRSENEQLKKELAEIKSKPFHELGQLIVDAQTDMIVKLTNAFDVFKAGFNWNQSKCDKMEKLARDAINEIGGLRYHAEEPWLRRLNEIVGEK